MIILQETGCSTAAVYMHGVRSEYMELRKVGVRRDETGLKDFSAEKYFWPCGEKILKQLISGYRIVVVYMHGVHVAAVRFCLARLKRGAKKVPAYFRGRIEAFFHIREDFLIRENGKWALLL